MAILKKKSKKKKLTVKEKIIAMLCLLAIGASWTVIGVKAATTINPPVKMVTPNGIVILGSPTAAVGDQNAMNTNSANGNTVTIPGQIACNQDFNGNAYYFETMPTAQKLEAALCNGGRLLADPVGGNSSTGYGWTDFNDSAQDGLLSRWIALAKVLDGGTEQHCGSIMRGGYYCFDKSISEERFQEIKKDLQINGPLSKFVKPNSACNTLICSLSISHTGQDYGHGPNLWRPEVGVPISNQKIFDGCGDGILNTQAGEECDYSSWDVHSVNPPYIVKQDSSLSPPYSMNGRISDTKKYIFRDKLGNVDYSRFVYAFLNGHSCADKGLCGNLQCGNDCLFDWSGCYPCSNTSVNTVK